VALDLYLVRHGGTEWTRTGQHTSRTDLPLLPDGEAEARRLAEHLRGIRWTAVYSSDMRRAIRTADLAGLPQPRVTPLLREYDYGEYEGMTTPEIRETRPGWDLWRDGVPGGETPAQVLARARAFIEDLSKLEGAVAACSHGHFLRALAVAWLDLDITVAAGLGLDTASVSVLKQGDRGRLIQHWNWYERLA
jgi:broad specificity phosphatase PhoE